MNISLNLPAKLKLKKDIVIKKGTIFYDNSNCTVNYEDGHYVTSFGLTKDTSGSIIYSIDDDPKLDDWFEVILIDKKKKKNVLPRKKTKK